MTNVYTLFLHYLRNKPSYSKFVFLVITWEIDRFCSIIFTFVLPTKNLTSYDCHVSKIERVTLIEGHVFSTRDAPSLYAFFRQFSSLVFLCRAFFLKLFNNSDNDKWKNKTSSLVCPQSTVCYVTREHLSSNCSYIFFLY